MTDGFGGLQKKYTKYKTSKIVVLPVPFDKTSTWIKGSDKGPVTIIEASKNMELYDIKTDSAIYKKGIFTDKPIKTAKSKSMIKKTYSRITKLIKDDKFVVILGGEHTVSLGCIQAYKEKYDDLSVLHLDAHTDMRDSYDNSKFNHACVMKRVSEFVEKTISVGIRSMDSIELQYINKNNIFFAHDIFDSNGYIKNVIRKLTKNVYVTIDLDVFDSSIMPATGTPEPGGMNWYQIINLLETVSQQKNIVGFDVVELCPLKGNKSPEFLAAKLIYCLLSYKFS